MNENLTSPSSGWENFRFFLFHYEREIRASIIALLLFGGIAWGKSSLDDWQVNRFSNWPVVTATILEVEAIEKPSQQKYRITSQFFFQASLQVEYRYVNSWFQEKVWISEIPLKDLQLFEKGKDLQLRVRPSKPAAPIFRWQDQIVREPTS